MKITVRSTLGDLVHDMETLPQRAQSEMIKVGWKHARAGNRRAKAFAKRTAGDHGTHYPTAFGVERLPTAEGLSWEYGPDASLPQGDMSFEWGSRNQPPHMDLAQSADVTGPLFAHDVAQIPDRLFW